MTQLAGGVLPADPNQANQAVINNLLANNKLITD
jgi:hypothetical protein